MNGIWIFFGDFNTVRFRTERDGSRFCPREADAFNNFIAMAGLHDFPLGGRRFTWFNKYGTK